MVPLEQFRYPHQAGIGKRHGSVLSFSSQGTNLREVFVQMKGNPEGAVF